jgi:hypothetical protein
MVESDVGGASPVGASYRADFEGKAHAHIAPCLVLKTPQLLSKTDMPLNYILDLSIGKTARRLQKKVTDLGKSLCARVCRLCPVACFILLYTRILTVRVQI